MQKYDYLWDANPPCVQSKKILTIHVYDNLNFKRFMFYLSQPRNITIY